MGSFCCPLCLPPLAVQAKPRGRKKGSFGPSPAVAKKLGTANLLYASGKLHEVHSLLPACRTWIWILRIRRTCRGGMLQVPAPETAP